MAPLAGVGYLIANDILTDVSYALIEPPVNQLVPMGGIAAGSTTVPVYDRAMYVGALIVVGANTANVEVVAITAVVVGVSFTANFINSHAAGDEITGATFPVQSTNGDPFFTQAEMLGYLGTAVNDFLTDCPLVIAIAEGVTVAPTQQSTALPSDCMAPVRVATGSYPLRETSQSNLDINDYRWQQAAATANPPSVYFRDKVGLQRVGIWPTSTGATALEVIYRQRGAEVPGLADGFIVPDPFLIYCKYRVLEYAYSKDGEQRNPGLAKYYAGRYAFGVKISNVFLEAINDPNLELAQ